MNRCWIHAILFAGWWSLPAGAFSFNLTFTGDFSQSQQDIFSSAAAVWEGHVTGYQAGINRSVLDVTIDSSPIDGIGNIIGSAGPDTASLLGGFYIANGGSVTIDSVDLNQLEAAGELDELALHELGHVLGFGTLWTHNGVYTDGSGQYTGAFGLAAYRDEFDPFASYVPVELEGGDGTADSHWDEISGGDGLTDITDAQGRDRANALMTGWTGPDAPPGGDTFLSDTTLMSLQDIGFVVHLAPEPSAFLLILVGLPLFLVRRRGSHRHII